MFLRKHPRKFFTPEEQDRIREAIRRAEDRTSAEIRVHLDCCARGEALEKAKEVFSRLGMSRTRLRNGVLLYLAVEDRKFAVLGDEGIHRAVPENYWEAVKAGMQRLFREGRFCQGVCQAVQEIGDRLKEHFPAEPDDRNELSDDLSGGE